MTNALTDAVQALATALGSEDWPAEATVPEDLVTPRIIAQAGDPYLDEEGITFAGEKNLHVELWLLVDLTNNEQAAADLDNLLAHVLTNLPDTWGVDNVGRPGPVNTANWITHGMPVRVSRFITL